MYTLRLFRRLVAAFAILATHAAAPAQTSIPSRPRVVAYVPNWIDTQAFAPTIDYPRITHINIAFENPTNDAGDMPFNDRDQVLIDAAHAHDVKVLISIGGGAASGDKTLLARYAHLLNDANRTQFAESLATYVQSHHFDGLDVDLEGPAITNDYGPFITALAKAFTRRHLLLTSALSKGYGGNHVPDAVFPHFDFVNVMAYDGAGYWNPDRPGQHSSLQFAKDNVTYWLNRGLPKQKLVLGVPFYGYGFGKAFRKRDYPYKTLVETYPGAEKADQVGETIWYNGVDTIRAKAEFARDQQLGGVMIWSLDSDAKGPHSLLTTLHTALTAPRATTQP